MEMSFKIGPQIGLTIIAVDLKVLRVLAKEAKSKNQTYETSMIKILY